MRRNKAIAKFDAPAVTEDLTFRLTVTGLNGSTATSDVTVHVDAGQTPIAKAGPDQAAIVGTIVTLDGTASQFAKNYDWVQTDGPAVTLTGANTPIATFAMPDANKPLVFKLKAKAGPDLLGTDTVTITKVADVLTITRAELRTGDGQLRVDGTSSVFSMPNVVSFYASDGVAKTHGATPLGTIVVDPVTLGTFAFRAEGITLPAGVSSNRHLHLPWRCSRERPGDHQDLSRSDSLDLRGRAIPPARPLGLTRTHVDRPVAADQIWQRSQTRPHQVESRRNGDRIHPRWQQNGGLGCESDCSNNTLVGICRPTRNQEAENEVFYWKFDSTRSGGDAAWYRDLAAGCRCSWLGVPRRWVR